MGNGILRKTAALSLALLTLLTAACAPAGTNDGGETTATESVTDTPTDAPTEEVATEAPTEEATESETYAMDSLQNPLSTGAAPDPVVVYHEGYYYATFTEALGIAIYRSKDLKTVLTDEKNIIMNLCDEVQGNVWAPELHYNPATDRWYVYASGSTNGWEFSSIRMFCLEGRSPRQATENLWKSKYFS